MYTTKIVHTVWQIWTTNQLVMGWVWKKSGSHFAGAPAKNFGPVSRSQKSWTYPPRKISIVNFQFYPKPASKCPDTKVQSVLTMIISRTSPKEPSPIAQFLPAIEIPRPIYLKSTVPTNQPAMHQRSTVVPNLEIRLIQVCPASLRPLLLRRFCIGPKN